MLVMVERCLSSLQAAVSVEGACGVGVSVEGACGAGVSVEDISSAYCSLAEIFLTDSWYYMTWSHMLCVHMTSPASVSPVRRRRDVRRAAGRPCSLDRVILRPISCWPRVCSAWEEMW